MSLEHFLEDPEGVGVFYNDVEGSIIEPVVSEVAAVLPVSLCLPKECDQNFTHLVLGSEEVDSLIQCTDIAPSKGVENFNFLVQPSCPAILPPPGLKFDEPMSLNPTPSFNELGAFVHRTHNLLSRTARRELEANPTYRRKYRPLTTLPPSPQPSGRTRSMGFLGAVVW